MMGREKRRVDVEWMRRAACLCGACSEEGDGCTARQSSKGRGEEGMGRPADEEWVGR